MRGFMEVFVCYFFFVIYVVAIFVLPVTRVFFYFSTNVYCATFSFFFDFLCDVKVTILSPFAIFCALSIWYCSNIGI